MRLLLASLVILLACEGDGVRLIVDVRTDLVPGLEFDEVRAISGSAEQSVEANEGDWIASNRVLDVRGLSRDAGRAVVVEVLRAGAVVVRTRAVVDNRRDAGVTLVLTRDCRGVSCAENERCFAGSCADDKCLDGTQPSCPDPECSVDSDCPDPIAECARATCVDEACIELGECEADALCDPDEGCVGEPMDAGPSDASLDVVVDAGVSAVSVAIEADLLLVNGMARAPDGVVVVGDVRGDVRAEGILRTVPVQSGFALFIDDAGEVRWLTVVEASGIASLRDVVVTPSGVEATGQFQGTTTIGVGRDAGSRQEPWIVRFDPDDGRVVGTRFFPADGANAQGRGLAIASDGVVALAGLYGRDLELSAPLPTATDDDGFFGLFGATGLIELPIIGGDNTAGNATVASLDRACVGGRFNGALTFGSITGFANPARSDALIACFDRSGTVEWSATYGGDEHDSVIDMVSTDTGGLLVAGYASQPFTIDSQPFIGFGSADAAIMRFDSSGRVEWIASAGGFAIDEAQSLAYAGGRIAAVGKHGPDARFGDAAAFAQPGGFFWELNEMGETLRALPIVSADTAITRAVALHGSDGWIIAIEHTGSVEFQGRMSSTARAAAWITTVDR